MRKLLKSEFRVTPRLKPFDTALEISKDTTEEEIHYYIFSRGVMDYGFRIAATETGFIITEGSDDNYFEPAVYTLEYGDVLFITNPMFEYKGYGNYDIVVASKSEFLEEYSKVIIKEDIYEIK